MKLIEIPIAGAFIVECTPKIDERGFFARLYSPQDFANLGLVTSLSQCSLSHSNRKGTLRGLHYQLPPYSETKLIRCIQGALFDVIVDLRPDSKTYLEHFTYHLAASSHQALYIPKGCAHGIQTLEDETRLSYQIDAPFNAESARGIRYDDPTLRINWPLAVTVISEKDKHAPWIDPGVHLF